MTGQKSVGFPDALRVHVDTGISLWAESVGKSKTEFVQVTKHVFSHQTWRKDPDRAEHETAKVRGGSDGGHFIYLVRKCRELPDTEPRLRDCGFLRSLPDYRAPAPPGELIGPFDKFKLETMRPLRRALQQAAPPPLPRPPRAGQSGKRPHEVGDDGEPIKKPKPDEPKAEPEPAPEPEAEDEELMSFNLDELIALATASFDESDGEKKYLSCSSAVESSSGDTDMELRRARLKELIEAYDYGAMGSGDEDEDDED